MEKLLTVTPQKPHQTKGGGRLLKLLSLTIALVSCGLAHAQPVISSLSAAHGRPGDPITIVGSGFNATPASNSVYFGATRATVTSASSTSLSVSVPPGATFAPVVVTNTVTSLTAYSQYPFLPTFNNSGYIADTTHFDSAVNFIPGSSSGGSVANVAIGDLDGDGKPDLVVSYTYEPTIAIYRNVSTAGTINSASFAARVDIPGYAWGLSLTDLDGDGKLDIIGGSGGIFRNVSSPGSITSSSFEYVSATPVIEHRLADMNADGKPDLLTVGFFGLTIWLNTSSSSGIDFADEPLFFFGPDDLSGIVPEYSNIVVGDIDGDGRPDVAIPNWRSNHIAVFRNKFTSGTFDETSLEPGVAIPCLDGPNGIAMGDMDGDGKLDIVLGYLRTTFLEYPYFTVLKNTATTGTIDASSFAAPVNIILPGGGPAGTGYFLNTTIADFNGDGKLDVVTPEMDYNDDGSEFYVLRVYRNVVSGGVITASSFVLSSSLITPKLPIWNEAGDLDGDGRSDIVLASQPWDGPDHRVLSIYRNALPASIAPITGTFTVCPGATASLSHASADGTWSSSNTAVATIGSSTGIASGVAAGTATISYTHSGGEISTAVVTVTTTPSAGTITGTLTTCTGNTTTLSNATTGGAWSSSNAAVATVNSSTGVVTGIAAGNATITYTVTNSCGSATTTAVVTVNAATSAGTITGTASICTGGTTTLSNAVTGGTWSSSNTAVATVNASTGVVTGAGAGNATITYTVSGSCGTATATTVVTVGATAGAISGSLAICPGSTSSLTTGSAGTWSSSNTSVATIGSASGVLSGVANGTATISFTSGSGCTATAVATVSLPAVLTGTFNACVGQTSTLSSATTGGVWSSANSAIASVDAATGVVTGVAAGSAYITYTTGTCHRTGNFVVKALPLAIAGPVTVCAGSTTNVPAPSSTGLSWTSSNTSVATIGSSTGILTGVAAGTTTLTYTTNTGCYTTTVATVNTAPAAITGTTALCAGNTATLSSATAGGTWSSSNTGRATIGSATGIVTAVNAGTAIITYNAGGCRTTTVVTVSAIAAITGSTSMCLGSSVNLTHATSGGTWSSSNTAIATVGTSGTVTGVAAGTASITYTIPSGCSRSVTVTVAATPGGVTGTLTACPGTTTALGSATAGGTWGGGNASIATINSSTGVVSGIGAGTITATYTIGTGCRSTAVVTINPLPAVMTGTFNVCVGLASTLANASAGGTWSTANAAIATADPSAGAITGVAAGTVAVSYTLPTGCYRATTFTVKALPPAPAASAACEGTTTAIAAPSTNGRSWSSSNATVATIGSSSGIMTGVTAGTTVLTYTTTTGCYSTTVATVYALPSAGTITGPATVIAGNTITLDNATGGGVWSSSNTSRATIGAATGIVTGVAAGSANISYSVSNPGCTVRATQVISVTASRDNSPATAATTVQLYPNPTTGAFTVVSQEAGMLSVYSLDGKQVTGYSIAAGANQLTLPADLAAGIYMCRYTSESGASTMVRLVYER